MERYDLLYRLYGNFDADAVRDAQDFVDLLPPLDSSVALSHWQEVDDELTDRKDRIRRGIPDGDRYAELAARATRDQAFTALDLYTKYGKAVNALVLDVDETLRSAGRTDNEIPREVLHLLTEFHEMDVPIVICTGQTLENVKGFAIQGLGNELVHSGDVSIVYEAGTGVFTPGHGPNTKCLLYETLDDAVQSVFESVRGRVIRDLPDGLRGRVHLQGNEFNVTLKPNFETGSEDAEGVIDDSLVYMLDLLGEAVTDDPDGPTWTRAYYAERDPEIEGVLADRDERPDPETTVPDDVAETLDRVTVAYYHADAAELSAVDLNKAAGVEAALEVLGVDDPFVLVMGDSKSDLDVMRWAADGNRGLAAAPDHSSPGVLEHVEETDGLVFDRGDAASMLRTAFALNVLVE
ncbi:HAD family hydrolase [Haloferax sp. MBLA0076]|uniref:HAD family hydrolase n=1 Tax=Haloferax litoreum TaxID=2666140 RepID=A0A6A8GL69_9EURY|nr:MULTISPECIES: HAD family hydrolase [Haloferax]KAB1194286.1 HAD family hydrolase [Haloferax sp. CBA1148]MRX22847.1 HAD family hydrolase [Haloferax litoreum]